jgi:integrase
MASISSDPQGRRTVQFVAGDGKRRSIRLSKVSLRIAEEFRLRVEALLTAGLAGVSPDPETARWVAGLPDATAEKLARVGLVAGRAARASRLGDFLDAYIAGRTDADPRTVTNLRIGAARLVDYPAFGRARELRTITAGDCDKWLIWLKGRYADATVNRTVKWARQFFRAAVREELLARNPFEGLQVPAATNEARQRFIDRDVAAQVLDACPSAEWRLIFALSRFGGLRCPSEHLALEWADVDWARGRFLVRSPKTGPRWVPLFPELRPHLEEVFELAAEGSTHVITRYHHATQNLRSKLLRILERAGVDAWPRLFHNLRATRETELAAEYPLHVVCAWIGNTERIAAKHYLQVTDADFRKAAGGAAESGALAALHNPVQQPAAAVRTEPQSEGNPGGDCELVRDGAAQFNDVQDRRGISA